MFKSIFVNGSLTEGSVILMLSLALVLGFAEAWYFTRRNPAVTRSFAFTLTLLPVITATVIMAVNGNLGAGIAVAGSFSLIRFRSVQGSGQEIIAIFLAAAIGLCLGAGYVRAKTGSLSGVSTLAGYVPGRDGAVLTFTLMSSGTPVDVARPAMDAVTAARRGCGCR